MKVIFLDIDGVLNANEDFGGRSKSNPSIHGILGITTTRIKRLKQIIDKTDAKIVLTSSWKEAYINNTKYHIDIYGRYLREKLRKSDIYIFDTTLDYESKGSEYRGTGIKAWLAAHKNVTNWIVLDDEIFCDYDKDIIAHLIKTSYQTGLTDELVNKAIDMLNQE